MHHFKQWREERRKPKETDVYKPLLHDFDLFTPWAEPGHVWPGKQKLHTYSSGRPDDEHGGLRDLAASEGGEDESVDEDEDLMAEVVAAEDDDDDNSDGEDEVEKILGSAAGSREDSSGARSQRKAQAHSLQGGRDSADGTDDELSLAPRAKDHGEGRQRRWR